MSEMVERVARAIFEAAMSMHGPRSYDACNDGQKEMLRREAKAAIEAMRPCDGDPVPGFSAKNPREFLNAVIDTALKDTA